MLSLQASLDPEDEVEIVMDRRCPRGVSTAESRGPVRQSPDRRRNTCVDLEVRTKGFTIVPRETMTSRVGRVRPVDNHEQADDELDREGRPQGRGRRKTAP